MSSGGVNGWCAWSMLSPLISPVSMGVMGGAADNGEGTRVRDAVLGARRRVERDPNAGAEFPGVTTAGAVDGRARRDLVFDDSALDSGVVGGEMGGRD